MSRVPISVLRTQDNPLDIIRAALIAESDAVNLYEQMARECSHERLKKLLLELAKDEKVHIGQLHYLMHEVDEDFTAACEEAKKENEELFRKK